MRNWLTKLAQKINQFMYGRYGTDKLNMFLLTLSIVMVFLSYFPKMGIFSLLAYILVIWALFRSLSKNLHKRRLELYKYEEIKRDFKGRISLIKQIWQNRKTHRYFRCKNCGNISRVPKGYGKIEVTCPKCKTKSIRKS
ncbi:MAG: hypothetical protein IJO47_02345 [Clostridia bacterium]|nr:hypothetical protein [Clostridia bacterium]